MGLLRAGGWGGLGQALQNIGQTGAQQDFVREREAMMEERSKRIAEYGDKLSRDRAQWEVKELGPEKNRMAAEGVKATEQARHDVKFDPANVDRELEAIRRETKTKTESEIEAMISTSKNGEYIRAVRNIALARQVTSPKIALQPQADGTILRIDMNAGKVLGTLNDPVSNKPIVSPKGMSEQQMALAKSYFDEGSNLIKGGEMEDGQAKLQLGREILMGKQPKEKPSPQNRPPLSTFNK